MKAWKSQGVHRRWCDGMLHILKYIKQEYWMYVIIYHPKGHDPIIRETNLILCT